MATVIHLASARPDRNRLSAQRHLRSIRVYQCHPIGVHSPPVVTASASNRLKRVLLCEVSARASGLSTSGERPSGAGSARAKLEPSANGRPINPCPSPSEASANRCGQFNPLWARTKACIIGRLSRVTTALARKECQIVGRHVQRI